MPESSLHDGVDREISRWLTARSAGCKTPKGYKDLGSSESGTGRVIYTIDDGAKLVTITR